jgi:hypothetical protein
LSCFQGLCFKIPLVVPIPIYILTWKHSFRQVDQSFLDSHQLALLAIWAKPMIGFEFKPVYLWAESKFRLESVDLEDQS